MDEVIIEFHPTDKQKAMYTVLSLLKNGKLLDDMKHNLALTNLIMNLLL